MTLQHDAPATHRQSLSTTFVDRIVDAARRHPDEVAVDGGAPGAPGRRTYAELLTSAARVAGHLRELGVAAGDRVGLQLVRDADGLAALLGVLLAGAVYVPLDPGHPAARREHVLAKAACRVLVTAHPLGDLVLPQGCTATTLDDAVRGPVLHEPVAREGGDSAYVLFTSGSTGVPKGVEITLSAATAAIDWAAGVADPEDLAAASATVSFGFDPSVCELFAPLTRGGTLRFFANALDPALASSTTAMMFLTPSVLQELLRARRLPATLRTVHIGGETLPEPLAREFFEAFPAARLLHGYGPTETTVLVSWQDLRADFTEITLGRPLPGMRMVLLDPDRREVLDGPGEICIGGPQVGVGYVDEPALTAERFITWQDGGRGAPVRLYRTGDKAVRGADGELRFLGRLDRQVKLRGFRVELEEVEVALRAQPGLTDATVLVEGEGATARLVAFGTTPAGAAATTAEAVLAGLRRTLPPYAVPATLLLLDRMPTTGSGKVDQVALRSLLTAAPAPGGSAVASGGAPLTVEERAVADVVARVLRLPVLPGAEDQVMDDLGATSLQLVAVHAALADRSGGGPDVGVLLADATVAELAVRYGTPRAGGAGAGGLGTREVVVLPAPVRSAGAPGAGGSWWSRAVRRSRS